MVELKARGVPAVLIAAPTWEIAAKLRAQAWKLSDKQVVSIPIGELFPDSTEAGEAMAEHMNDILPSIIAGLKEASKSFAKPK
ncbi:hypothetical protein ACFLUK_01980 [Chloroflexota bacterium]